MSPDGKLTTKEAADIAGVHSRTIITWIRRGWLVATKLPGARGRYQIRREDLEQVVNRQAQPDS